MKTIGQLILFLCCCIAFLSCSRQQSIPKVYNVENRGKDFEKPVLSDLDELPVVEGLTDPFAWSDGSGRSTKFSDWSKRRNEIAAEIQHYEIGPKPARPDSISANFENDTLTVNITVNGKTLTLKSGIILPDGEGPFPAVIGIGRGSGSLPADLFSKKKYCSNYLRFQPGGGLATETR